ncbi:MAG: carboxypeptidase-like regulatory domain-containing protein, partial [Candidatus Caldarchaeum sp.]
VNGSVTFDLVPAGSHSLTVSMNDVKVFEGVVEADGYKTVVVDAGLVRVVVKDQRGNPVAGVEVEIPGVGKSRAGADGVVSLGQMPAGEYRYQARYKGFNLFSGVVKPGLAVNLTLPLYTLRTEVVNELNNPLEAVIEITREGVLLERRSGVEAYFTGLPQGPYLVRATVEPKQVEQQVLLTSDGQAVRITMPIVLAFGSILMSSSDLITIITPLAAALVAMVSTFFLSKAVRRKAKRAKGMV